MNPQQREAVCHVDGPLLILAGAGSGKTRVITYRIAYLIGELGVLPGRILAVTFTNKAAEEMRERATSLVGPAAGAVWISTFHSFCVRVLRRDAGRLGLKSDFSIFDRDDQVTAIRQALRDLSLNEKVYPPANLLAVISGAKNELVGPDQYDEAASGPWENTVARVYKQYQNILRANGALDFDDLLVETVRLFREHADVLRTYQDRFWYVMVDEYQDTNHAQYVLIRLLAARHRNLCVVGDEDQSIYGWRGADIRNILDFEKDYPDARIVKLEENYRSTRRILEAANNVISNNSQRKEKLLWTRNPQGDKVTCYYACNERDEARFVADEILSMAHREHRAWNDFAVLYRMNSQSRVLEEELLHRGIPYQVIGGVRFYERKEIKDILAYLRVLLNPLDSISLRRIINVPRRGLGDLTVERLGRFARQHKLSLYEAMSRCDEIPEMAARTCKAVQEFIMMMDELRGEVDNLSLPDLISRVMDKTGYLNELEQEKTVEAESRIENIKELLSVAQEFVARHALPENEQSSILEDELPLEGKPSIHGEKEGSPSTAGESEELPGSRPSSGPSGKAQLSAFLEEVALVSDVDTLDNEQQGVTLMTLHSAKGLEFPVVFIVGMEEGVFPHSRSLDDYGRLEEERRLCYVGMTRAQERLYLSHARQRLMFGQYMDSVPSRFIREVPKSLLEERVSQGWY
ncbi:MAG TPA: UvrD-helicase domain-containing protein [Firmicutes bacterium]|nr:UvrD-helicase domain-containing protein [Bacillota bacterium]